jgi:chemotaxis protein methyltransferase CheR
MCNHISEEILKELSLEVQLRFGLYFPVNRFSDFTRCIINAANLKGVEIDKYTKLFLEKKLSSEDYKELANCLTIGETYFFRDKRLFDTLRENIIPKVIESKRQSKKITIWSSGCSTGEEPYTIAILLKEILLDYDKWDINIIATDININSLQKAKEAVYGEWSFRETDINFKNRYFDIVEDNRYKLKEDIKKSVKFSYLNLAENFLRVDNINAGEVDIVFCRNVLMYFSEEQARKIIDKYYYYINNNGWLIVAPSESLFLNKSDFVTTNVNDIFLYHKIEKVIQSKIESNPFEKLKVYDFSMYNTPVNNNGIEKLNFKIEEDKSEKVKLDWKQVVVSDTKVDYETTCREKANEGNLIEAKEICKKAIEQNKVKPEYYYLLASIEQEQGNLKEAVNALKKTIFLDSNFIMAYFDLGNLFLKQGKSKEALKNFQNVNMLLEMVDDEFDIPHVEDMTAGILKSFIKNMVGDKELNN